MRRVPKKTLQELRKLPVIDDDKKVLNIFELTVPLAANIDQRHT